MQKSILISLILVSSIPAAAIADTVSRILDGDTLEVRQEGKVVRVRLANIDAPEKSQPFGQRAKQALIAQVKDIDDLAIRSRGTDQYGRTLGDVYVKRCRPLCYATYVNAEMVKSGFAWAYRYHGKVLSTEMLKLENEARASKAGLWSSPDAIEPWRYRRTSKSE